MTGTINTNLSSSPTTTTTENESPKLRLSPVPSPSLNVSYSPASATSTDTAFYDLQQNESESNLNANRSSKTDSDTDGIARNSFSERESSETPPANQDRFGDNTVTTADTASNESSANTATNIQVSANGNTTNGDATINNNNDKQSTAEDHRDTSPSPISPLSVSNQFQSVDLSSDPPTFPQKLEPLDEDDESNNKNRGKYNNNGPDDNDIDDEDFDSFAHVPLDNNNNNDAKEDSPATPKTTTSKASPNDAGVFSSFSLPWRSSKLGSTPSNSNSPSSTSSPPSSRPPPTRTMTTNSTEDSHSSWFLRRFSTQQAMLDSDKKAKRASIQGQEALRKGFEKLHNQIVQGEINTDGEASSNNNGNSNSNSNKNIDPSKPGKRGSSNYNQDNLDEDGDESDIDWVFWGNVMNDYEHVAKTQGKELAQAIQQGIPKALRGMAWQLLSSSKDLELEATYSQLLKLKSPHEKSIIRDINRTFPQHTYFQDGRGAGQENLFHVVKAYSLYDPDVGYCQGLQFIVGPLLLNMPEEEAFCVLVRLMKSYNMRTHFLPNMPGLQLRLYQFDRLLEEFAPHISVHLLRLGIKSSMYASQWILTLFAYRFPLELISRVFDLVFAEGVEAVFRFSISVMLKNEKTILEKDFETVLEFLKTGIYECYKNDGIKNGVNKQEDEKQEQTNDGEEETKSENGNENENDGALNNSFEDVGRYRARQFSKEALAVRITPQMLDAFRSEFETRLAEERAKDAEIASLREINRYLSSQVNQLQSTLAQVNQEHCDLVKQVVNIKLEKEDLEEQLVNCKLRFADLAHRQAEEEMGSR